MHKPTNLLAQFARRGTWPAAAIVTLALLTTSAGAQPESPTSLTLVYLDTGRPDHAELWAAGADGSEPRLVAELPLGTRVLDLRGPLVALDAGDGLMVLDLRSGEQRAFPVTGALRSARLGEADAAVYTTGFNCQSVPDQLPPPGRLVELDLATGEEQQRASFGGQIIDLVGYVPATQEATVVVRGCDGSFRNLWTLNLESDIPRWSTVEGCGWVQMAPDGQLAVAGWQGCTPPETHEGAVATVYDLATNEERDLKAFTNATVQGEMLFSPDGSVLAAGGFFGGVAGPLGSTSGTVWLVNSATLDVKPLLQGAGVEAFPVDWSPDGQHLLVGGVEAQGRCSYQIIESATSETQPVNPEITVCGSNGEVIGWTEL